MSEHVGYVIKVEHLRPHSNADRLQVLTVFGEDTCVSLDVKIGDIGIYFPCDLQLSEEYCDQNHLCRKTATGEKDTGYLERNTRHVTAIRLRGEKSSGLYMPLSSLDYCGGVKLTPGDKVEVVNGHEICKKYIPHSQYKSASRNSEGNRTRKKVVPIAPLFREHADTEQLAYNLAAFRPGDLIEITLKMHGTSQRTGYLPKYQREKRSLLDKILRRPGTPIYEWGYVSGTRRTVLKDFESKGYYDSNEFRAGPAQAFEGKLNKGETVYYEVVGFQDNGVPIMASQSNDKVDKLIGDKSFSKQYGATTVFSYGCEPDGDKKLHIDDGEIYRAPQTDFYVYRMTMTNEDGDVVEYTPDFMRYRCEQMGVKTVPVFWKGYIPNTDEDVPSGEWIKNIAEEYYDGPDPIGKSHVREGVVVRIVNRPKFCAYKHKNFGFKVLEGIVKESAEAPDMEEAEDLIKEGEV